ncbi:MAG: VOC family protein [Pseudomonadota bacterium]
MKFGYTIVYVPDVTKSVEFFEQAFGLARRFVHESGDYGELETGDTTLAFAAISLSATNLPEGVLAPVASDLPVGIEIALVTDDVQGACVSAADRGAEVLAAPAQKPWGQTVAYVRCPDGTLVELCTPISS